MSDLGKHKLSDAVPRPEPFTGEEKTGQPESTPETVAEQARAAEESKQAVNDQASIRERMVDIGRGHQQAGRQGQ